MEHLDVCKTNGSSGLPARSSLQPPSINHVPNPDRPSNPFSVTTQPEWVERQTGQGPSLPARIPHRDLPSATNGAAMPPLQPMKSSIGSGGQVRIPNRSASQVSSASAASAVSDTSSGKVMQRPSVPRKPVQLSSYSSQNPALGAIKSPETIGRNNAAPAPPPPRRSNTGEAGRNTSALAVPPRASPAKSLLDDEDGIGKPSLPPRSNTAAFMDDADEGGDGGSLSSWQPLRPT